MFSRPPVQRREHGLAALSLLTVGMLIALGILFAMAIPLTQASDAKAKSRSAADAAALAGADHVQLELRKLLEDPLTLVTWLQDGSVPLLDSTSTAGDYARLNDATLVEYTGPTVLNDWTAYARVKGRTVGGETTESEATAQFDLPGCFKQQPEPTDPPPEPDESDEDDEGDEGDEPPPPPDEFSCGGAGIAIPADPTELAPSAISDFLDELFDDSDAKLID